jgi:hypothetical protein
MTIRDELDVLCGKEVLFRLSPQFRIERERRALYVSTEIHKLIFGPKWTSPVQEFRWQSVRADLDWFIQARVILVPLDSQRGGNSHMAQLKPPHNEVWDIRCRDPQPGIRVLGSFAEKDVFVALTWEMRNPLGRFGSKRWEEAILRCKAEWQRLLYAQPMRGNYPDDYITNAIPIGDP